MEQGGPRDALHDPAEDARTETAVPLDAVHPALPERSTGGSGKRGRLTRIRLRREATARRGFALPNDAEATRTDYLYEDWTDGCIAVSNVGYPLGSTLVERRALEYASTFGLPVFLRPEDRHLRADGCVHEGAVSARLGLPSIPSAAESVAVARDLALAEHCDAKVHFRALSTLTAARMLTEAQAAGLNVTADVAAHQLHLTEHDISNFNSDCHVIPPLRTQRDMEALRQAVADGTIDAISSDHQPHDFDAKQSPFAGTEPGISALETYLPLCMRLQELTSISLPELVTRMSTSPASILGIDAGTLSVGATADICIYSDDDDWQLSQDNMVSQGKNTPFHGWEMQGEVRYTLLDGEVIYRKD